MLLATTSFGLRLLFSVSVSSICMGSISMMVKAQNLIFQMSGNYSPLGYESIVAALISSQVHLCESVFFVDKFATIAKVIALNLSSFLFVGCIYDGRDPSIRQIRVHFHDANGDAICSSTFSGCLGKCENDIFFWVLENPIYLNVKR